MNQKQVSPAVAGVIVAIVLAVAIFFIWRSTAGPPGPAPGQVGNAGPFDPGGPANGKGAKPAAAGGSGKMPGGGAPVGSGGN